MHRFPVHTNTKCEMINIDRDIKKIIDQHGYNHGLVIIFTPHTTAGITINENADPDVKLDIIRALDRIVPETGHRHAEGNSPAHIKPGFCIKIITKSARRAGLKNSRREFFNACRGKTLYSNARFYAGLTTKSCFKCKNWVKSSMLGCSAQVLLNCGKLELGTWQSVFLCEFDGPRHREVWVQVLETPVRHKS